VAKRALAETHHGGSSFREGRKHALQTTYHDVWLLEEGGGPAQADYGNGGGSAYQKRDQKKLGQGTPVDTGNAPPRPLGNSRQRTFLVDGGGGAKQVAKSTQAVIQNNERVMVWGDFGGSAPSLRGLFQRKKG